MCEVADTPGKVAWNNSGYLHGASLYRDIGEGRINMSNTIRIKLKAYDHRVLDNAATKIVETIKRSGGIVSGPVPLPTDVEKFTILRAVHKYKDSREQFEMRTHKRLIDVKNPNKEVVDALAHLELPSGIDIQIKQ